MSIQTSTQKTVTDSTKKSAEPEASEATRLDLSQIARENTATIDELPDFAIYSAAVSFATDALGAATEAN